MTRGSTDTPATGHRRATRGGDDGTAPGRPGSTSTSASASALYQPLTVDPRALMISEMGDG
eukprot:scaffold32624_cov230-Isochrysis_galbana.AAC.1